MSRYAAGGNLVAANALQQAAAKEGTYKVSSSWWLFVHHCIDCMLC